MDTICKNTPDGQRSIRLTSKQDQRDGHGRDVDRGTTDEQIKAKHAVVWFQSTRSPMTGQLLTAEPYMITDCTSEPQGGPVG